MEDTATIAIVLGTFLIAGTVKGVIGLGLPTVSLGLLTVAIGLPHAMALLLVPSFATNLWQAAVGGHARSLITRIWPFLVMATGTVWLGAMALTRIDANWLSAILGLLLISYAAINLGGFRPAISTRGERWLGPLTGIMNGVLTGMTGSFVVPGVLFLQAIGLPRDMLIQAMGLLFTASTLALAVALHGNRLLTADLGSLSLVALLPAVLGMIVGQRIRLRLSESLFRRVFFVALMVLGLYITATSLA